MGNRRVLRIARKDIVLNQQNMRWECEAKNASQPGQCVQRRFFTTCQVGVWHHFGLLTIATESLIRHFPEAGLGPTSG